MSKLSIKPTGNGHVQLGHIGSVIDVIAARISSELLNKRFNAADYAYAFEIGTPKEKESLGESILLNGVCYTTSTDKNSTEYYHTICGKEFMTSGIFVIPHTAKPTHIIHDNNSTISLDDFYKEIYLQIKKPLAFVATAELVDCHTTAVCKAPIDGKDIFQNKQEYYAIPAKQEKNIQAFIMGALTDYNDKQHEQLNKQLEVVLYRNPFDMETGLTTHAHVLTLKKPVKNIEEINEKIADRSLHLFVEGTSLSNLRAEIYAIDNLIDLA